MTTDDTKKRILHLVERYAGFRVAEELAGYRDNMATVKRHHDAGKEAWSKLGEEIDKLIAAPSIRRVLAQIIRAPSANWRGMTGIRVIVDGEVIGTGEYGGEPEDNCEYRDYKWVKVLLVALANKLGASTSIDDVEVDGPTKRAASEAYYAAMAAPAPKDKP